MSSIVNDCELGDSVPQPSTVRQRGTLRRSCINTSSPTSSAGDTRPRRNRRTHPTSAVEHNTNEGNASCSRQERRPTTTDVLHNTNEGSVSRRRQKRRPAAAAVEHNTNEGNASRIRQKRRPAAAGVEPNTSRRNTRPRIKRKPATRPRIPAIQKDLTPAQRAIPGTSLLHNLGNHLSAYARVGRGPPTQNLNCRGAWRTAIKLYHISNDQYKALFLDAGFGDFLEIKPVELPVSYSLALMERWFGETNTLHLPCGEIGPTPVDWTMITGLRFGGQCIGVNSEFSMNEALSLLGKPKAKKHGKILLSEIMPSGDEVRENPPTVDAKEKVFRRLFLYIITSCFLGNDHSAISHMLVKCLKRIDEVGKYDWGGMTYSAFLSGMRRKVTGETGAFTAFWQFLPYWAFEYLDINRPKHCQGNVFPRAKRWICPETTTEYDNPHFFGPRFIATRCQLNYVEESQVNWEPYLSSPEYRTPSMLSTINLAKKRIPFQSIETYEYYLGERCLRQFGFPCQVPKDPPRIMHGTLEKVPHHIWDGISAVNLVDESLEYSSWFEKASIGRILNVNPFLGGVNLAGKVLSQWMAKHQPDLILTSEAEHNKLKEDRNALEEECAKLRDQLSQAKIDSSSRG